MAQKKCRRTPRLSGPSTCRAPAACTVLLLVLASAAAGEVIVVDSSADLIDTNGDCTLREAILAANGNSAVDQCAAGDDIDDTISIPGTLAISLSGTLPTIDAPVTIVGGGDAPVPITGFGFRCLIVDADGVQDTVRLDGLSFGCLGGGGITAREVTLELEGMLFGLNTGGTGGAVRIQDGDLAVRSSTFLQNAASEEPGLGGALYARDSTLLVEDSSFEGNSASAGGAIYFFHIDRPEAPSDLVVRRVEFVENDAGSGGAVHAGSFSNSSTMRIEDSLFARNTASTDMFPGFSGRGGALNGGGATLHRVTFDENAADEGGAIFSAEDLVLTNVTLDSNQATALGLAIALSHGETTFQNVTVSGHSSPSGFVLDISNQGSITIADSIFDNEADNCYAQLNSTIDSLGGNLSSDLSCLFTGTGDLENTGAALEPMADNGGVVPTRAPMPGSPAIDAAVGSCAAHDARGLPRPRDGDGNGSAICDRGAHELAPGLIFFDGFETGDQRRWN